MVANGYSVRVEKTVAATCLRVWAFPPAVRKSLLSIT